MLYFFCENNKNFKQHLEDNFWKTATLMLLDWKKVAHLKGQKYNYPNQGETDANKTQNLGMYVANDTIFF